MTQPVQIGTGYTEYNIKVTSMVKDKIPTNIQKQPNKCVEKVSILIEHEKEK